MSAPPEHSASTGPLAVLVASGMFSWGFVIVKALGLPAGTIAGSRLLIGALTLSVIARIRSDRWPQRWRWTVAAGLGFGAHQLLYISAVQRTSVAVVATVGALQPLLATLASQRFVGEKLPRSFLAWSLLGLVGVALIVGGSFDSASGSWLGNGLAVVNLGAILVYFLCGKKARQQGAGALTMTASIYSVALLVVVPFVIISGLADGAGRGTSIAGWQWGLLALLALGPGNGHLLVNWAHARVSVALASIILTAVPVLASLWAFLLLDEPLGPRQLLGFALVTISVEGARRAEASYSRKTPSPSGL